MNFLYLAAAIIMVVALILMEIRMTAALTRLQASASALAGTVALAVTALGNIGQSGGGAPGISEADANAVSDTLDQANTLLTDKLGGGKQAAGPLSFTAPTLDNGLVGTFYHGSVAAGATGGVAPLTFAGTFTPDNGLSIGSDGSLTGAPTASGTSSATVTVTDSASPPNSVQGSITVAVDPAV